MGTITTLLIIGTSSLALFGLFSLYQWQRLRLDLDRSAEGSMLGAEFGAFSLPQAQLSPDADARRRCRYWSASAVIAISGTVISAAIGLAF